MNKVNNNEFLMFFEETDLIKYYYDCMNIANAGQSKTAVKSMEYYTFDGLPSESFVSLCENIFEEIIIEINTEDTALINDILSYVKGIAKNYKKIRIGALNPEFYASDVLKKYFKVQKTYSENYGVYAQYSENDVPETETSDNVHIDLVGKKEKEQFLSFDDDEWDGLSSIVKFSMQDENGKEIFFIIKENDTVCGYIIGDCAARNVYDIGNVFVHEKYRGKGYGKLLTVAFSKECYKRNCIPHYGTAVSKYSEVVAVKSGFTEVSRHYYADIKKKLFL